jgi:hypothetical protein
LLKYDKFGEILWTGLVGGETDSEIRHFGAVALDPFGGIYVAGGVSLGLDDEEKIGAVDLFLTTRFVLNNLELAD